MCKVHKLKTDPDVFQASWGGVKTFEIRINDRGFQVSDILRLRELLFANPKSLPNHDIYTGRTLDVVVMHVLRGPRYGLADGWVIMAVRKAGESVAPPLHLVGQPEQQAPFTIKQVAPEVGQFLDDIIEGGVPKTQAQYLDVMLTIFRKALGVDEFRQDSGEETLSQLEAVMTMFLVLSAQIRAVVGA